MAGFGQDFMQQISSIHHQNDSSFRNTDFHEHEEMLTMNQNPYADANGQNDFV